MYILQDGVLKPLTVMYQQGATTAGAAAAAPAATATYGTAAPAVQTAVTYATPATAYGTAAAPAAPSSTGGTTTAAMYQQAATTAGTAQYTYAVPGTDASGAQTWTVQQVGGQVAAATSAPLATAPATYTTAAGYGVSVSCLVAGHGAGRVMGCMGGWCDKHAAVGLPVCCFSTNQAGSCHTSCKPRSEWPPACLAACRLSPHSMLRSPPRSTTTSPSKPAAGGP